MEGVDSEFAKRASWSAAMNFYGKLSCGSLLHQVSILVSSKDCLEESSSALSSSVPTCPDNCCVFCCCFRYCLNINVLAAFCVVPYDSKSNYYRLKFPPGGFVFEFW